jgi:hypothetical protein
MRSFMIPTAHIHCFVGDKIENNEREGMYHVWGERRVQGFGRET